MNAWRCGSEDWSGLACNHLKRRNQQQQAGYNRKSRHDSDPGDEEHDDSEGALVQAVHEPAKREMISRHLIVQLLQHDGRGNKQPGVGRH